MKGTGGGGKEGEVLQIGQLIRYLQAVRQGRPQGANTEDNQDTFTVARIVKGEKRLHPCASPEDKEQ